MKIELRSLSIDDWIDIYTMLQGIWFEEKGFWNLFNGLSFEEYKEQLVKQFNMWLWRGLPLWYTIQRWYWFYVDNNPVWVAKYRPILNEKLLRDGWNIGYAINKDFRWLWYWKLLLREVVKLAKQEGLSKLLITIDEDNIPSRRVAEDNCWVLEDILNWLCRYWIPL